MHIPWRHASSIALIVAMVFSNAGAEERTLRLAVRGGLSLARLGYAEEDLLINFDDDVLRGAITLQNSMRAGATVGANALFKMNDNLAIDLRAKWVMGGTKLEGSGPLTFVEDPSVPLETVIKIEDKFNYVGFPMMLRWTKRGARAQPYVALGPQVSILASAKEKIEQVFEVRGFAPIPGVDEEVDLKDDTQLFGFGLHLLVGVEAPWETAHGFVEIGLSLRLTDAFDLPPGVDLASVRSQTVEFVVGVGHEPRGDP